MNDFIEVSVPLQTVFVGLEWKDIPEFNRGEIDFL